MKILLLAFVLIALVCCGKTRAEEKDVAVVDSVEEKERISGSNCLGVKGDCMWDCQCCGIMECRRSWNGRLFLCDIPTDRCQEVIREKKKKCPELLVGQDLNC
nr:venom protein [Lampona murina]